MKKLFILILTFAITLSSTGLSFANEHIDSEKIHAEYIAGIVQSIGDIEIANATVVATKSEYRIIGDDLNSSIPKEGDGKIEINIQDEIVKISLPKEIKNETGILTQKDMIVYNAIDEHVSVGVQQEKSNQNETLRVLLNIENSTAPKEYSFKYDLPEGYRIVTMESFCNNYITMTEREEYINNGSLLIISSENEPVTIIDAPWAKDKNGTDINTYYVVKGNEIIQYVDFNESTAFPVVADPGHGTVTRYEEFVEHKVAVSHWLEPEGQGTLGVNLDSGDAVSYSPGGGGKCDLSLSLGLGYGAYSFGISVGYAGKGESMGYIKRASVAGRYKLKVKKAVDYDIYKKMMRWKENGETHIMEYGRVGRNEEESVNKLILEAQ